MFDKRVVVTEDFSSRPYGYDWIGERPRIIIKTYPGLHWSMIFLCLMSRIQESIEGICMW